MGYVDGRGHSGRVGRGHGHDPVFHSRVHGRNRGLERGCVRRDHRRSRVNGRGHGRGHSLFGGHSLSYQVRSACRQTACRRDDSRLFLARSGRIERDRASPCNEDDGRDGTSRGMVDASGAVEIYVESVDVFLEEDDLGEPQSRV